MHPWLAGAQYRTTAVVLVYRLISLIGPHCPASTYSERDKLRACVCIHGRRCSAIGALFAKYLPGYHEYNAIPQKFVHATVKRRANKRTIRVRPEIPKFSNPLFTWIGTVRASSILMLGGVAGLRRGRERPWTIPYISRGRFMEIRPSDPLDTMIGGLDTIEIAAPVPYVSATFLDSHAGAMNDDEARGSLAVPPLNMEESQEITIRRVRGGLGEFRCHVNYCLYAVSDSN
ncbi:hypothetical protein ALC62_02662 [Cyphomyrmex costatus]|uniref:Uncharacterized protein n=1 Tax=Cyphomyrmex costatus TaxID=456900 RepID=A0A195D079_9HYME|nr:hypothetical protein ALC62_02662 [Cyphomyrmex costatus]